MATFYTYKNKDGKKRYKFKVYLGLDPVTGKRIETSRQGFKSKKEAKRVLENIQADYNKNGWKNSDKNKNLTVNNVYETWHSTWKLTVRESTQYNVDKRYNKHFKNTIGTYKITKITPMILQKFINKLATNYLSFKQILSPLKQTFKYAYRMNIINSNPFDKITYPKKEKEIHENFYSKDELKEFLSKVKKSVSFQNYARFYLLAFTGMRAGELMALQWEDIDLKNHTIHIKHTISRKLSSATYQVTEPKTKASNRTISISDGCVKILNQLSPAKKGLIFPGKNGQPMQREVISASLKYFFKHHPEMKPITPHGFRHTHATLLLEAGATIKEVQARLGHTDVQTTLNIYTHIINENDNNVAQIFDNFLN